MHMQQRWDIGPGRQDLASFAETETASLPLMLTVTVLVAVVTLVALVAASRLGWTPSPQDGSLVANFLA